MKFVSWNVNGLRACIQKGFLDEFNRFNADFFCLQETKLSEGQLQLDLPGYEQYWCYAEKKGYSGTAIFTKHTPLSVSYGIGVPELDNEGRVITLEYREFYLLTCYTPNAQRELARIDHRMKWDEAFRTYLQKLDETKPVIICGDLNVAHKEIDLKNPSSNRNNAGFSDQERQSFQKTLDLGFTDTFRHLYPDATGCSSWWSYMFHARENNAGWRIDYFLVSDRLKEQIYRAQIHSDILGSDHCPVSLELDTLVNGGLWSPECGRARVTEPEPVHEVEPTPNVVAVPVSTAAKVVRTVCIVLAVLLAVGIGFWLFPQEPPISPSPKFTVTRSLIPYQRMDLDVTIPAISSKPLDSSDAISEYMDGDAVPLISEDSICYVSTLDRISSANFFLRVDAPEGITPDGWQLTLDVLAGDLAVDTGYDSGTDPTIDLDLFGASSWADEVTDILFFTRGSAELKHYRAVPYYTDETLSDFAGWLIWGELDGYTLTDLMLTATNSGYHHFSTTISTVPYLQSSACQTLATEELLLHITQHPEIHIQLTLPKESDALLVQQSNELIYKSLRLKYPVLVAFETRKDVIQVLMDIKFDFNGELNNLLLTINPIQSRMTPQEETLYITGQYATSQYHPECPEILYSLDDMLTSRLLDSMLDYGDLYQQLSRCSTNAVRSNVYRYHLGFNPFLQEFVDREDALDVLMEASLTYSDMSIIWLIDLYRSFHIYCGDDMPDMIIPELPPVEIEPTESIPE